MDTIRLGNVYDDEKYTGGNFGGNVWGGQGLAPTLKTGASASQQCTVEIVPFHTHRGGAASNEERHDTVRCTRHCGSELSGIEDEERQSDRQWTDLPDINNGEYP